MKLGPFGFQRVNNFKRLSDQSFSWMKKTDNELDFFESWKREYSRIKEQNVIRGKAHRDKIGKNGLATIARIYYSKRRDENILAAREYRKRLKDDPIKYAEHLDACRKRKISRRRSDPVYALGVRIRTRIGMAFRYYRVAKRIKSIDALGCSAEQFKTHIESLWLPGMSWDNYGLKGWHIDHKRPIALFDISNDDEAKAAFHYSNTQPLWYLDNLSKGAKVV